MAQMHDIQICPEMRYSYSDPLHFIWWKQFGLTFKIHIMEIVETEREKGGFDESGINGEKICEYFCKRLWIFLQKIVIVNIYAKFYEYLCKAMADDHSKISVNIWRRKKHLTGLVQNTNVQNTKNWHFLYFDFVGWYFERLFLYFEHFFRRIMAIGILSVCWYFDHLLVFWIHNILLVYMSALQQKVVKLKKGGNKAGNGGNYATSSPGNNRKNILCPQSYLGFFQVVTVITCIDP